MTDPNKKRKLIDGRQPDKDTEMENEGDMPVVGMSVAALVAIYVSLFHG